MDISGLTTIAGYIIYAALAGVALWGLFCIVMVWQRISQKRFRSEAAQLEFLETLDAPLAKGDFDSALILCEGDPRAIPQLAHMAIQNRRLGFAKSRELILDRFQRDVLSDLEHRLSWVNTVIKSAPMLGLFGTVTGMMGAFGKLAAAESVKADLLAEDISFALVTTACGLAIAIPLLIGINSVNVQIRKFEDLAAAGLTRFLEAFRAALGKSK
jgi:biopolymer transport protein ExbB/TolQ